MRSSHTLEGFTVHQLSFTLWTTFDLDLLFLNVLQITGLSPRFQVAEYVYYFSKRGINELGNTFGSILLFSMTIAGKSPFLRFLHPI